MSFLESLKEYFDTQDLYEVLCLPKTASESEIKRAYRRLSLQVHPDRAAEQDKAKCTGKFQCLSKVYSILSDSDKRSLYDESGEIDDEVTQQERDWDAYWRLLFKKISFNDIKEFEASYKRSQEELSDLKSAYMDYEGDMEQILENVLCCTHDDEDRFREILDECIKNKELPKYANFTREPKAKRKARKKKAAQEAAEAEEMADELGISGNSEKELHQLILKRHCNREAEMNDMIAGLEAKYCKPKAAKKKKSATKSKK
ncbi:hypothetical protein QZH41_003660 [Actinostola sp. cb2023]|nr:hypothetical protein QZH41_003660 [Actinostola sp. cb2023]